MRLISLILWIALCLATGGVGAQFLPGQWYAELAKPSWNPPDSVFAPVWTTLYVLMGTAAWLVWKRAGLAGARGVLALFIAHLGLNSLWSYLFFGVQQPSWALVELVVLWAVILILTVGFWRVTRPAGILLMPYLAWVSFAGVLNFQLWSLNS